MNEPEPDPIRGRRRRGLAGPAALMVAFGIAGCGGGGHTAAPPTPAPRVVAAQQRATRAGSITAAIHLRRSTVRAGATITGAVVFVNRTGAPKRLLHGCQLDGFFGIAIRSRQGHTTLPSFSAVGCDVRVGSPPPNPDHDSFVEMVAPTGTSVRRFTLTAPRAPGRYTARFVPNGTGYRRPQVTPARFRVTSARP